MEAHCPRFITPEEPDLPQDFLRWVRRIARLDSMRAAGCRFRLDDLDPETWTALVALQGEKGRMERLVLDAKDRVRKAEAPPREAPETAAAMKEARKHSKAPPPGGTLFKHGRPIR